MSAYADWGYYSKEYLGAEIQDCEFPRLALRATEYLDSIAEWDGPRDETPSALKKACCAVAEVLHQEEEGGIKASESVGGYSVNYAVGAAASVEERKHQAARRYLLPAGLLYRGYGG